MKVTFFLAFSLLAAPVFATDGTWETVFVPEGSKAVIVDEDMPELCLSVEVWGLRPPTEPEECLVVGPGAECSD